MIDLNEAADISNFYSQCGMLAIIVDDLCGAEYYFKLARQSRQVVLLYYFSNLSLAWNTMQGEA